jgi:hypothetical protein
MMNTDQNNIASAIDMPPKTGPNIMLGPEGKNFRRKKFNGPKKVLTKTDHQITQRS